MLKTNNKKIISISKMKNAILDDNKILKNIHIIEYEDNSINIIDLKNNVDITEKNIGFDENTKIKFIFKTY